MSTSHDDSAPGAARAPGFAVKETLEKDSRGAPPPLLEENFEFLGDEDIACIRCYIESSSSECFVNIIQLK